MRGALVIARHDLRQTFADRGALFFMMLLPIFFAVLVGLVTGGSDEPSDSRATLTLVDEDGGVIAQKLSAALESERIVLDRLSAEEAALAEDKVRTLYLPEGLSERVLAGEEVTLELRKDAGSNAEAGTLAETRIYAAIARVIGELVELSGEESPVSAETLAAHVPREAQVTVEARFAGGRTIPPSGFTQSVPGNIVMFVMLIAMTWGAASISGERQGGLLRRLASAPVSRGEIVLGKILGRALVGAVQVTLLLAVAAIGMPLIGEDLGAGLPLAYLLLLVFALTAAPIGALLGALIEDPSQAANAGVLATLAMGALGGCWWPIEVVSPGMQRVALLLPTGWAMEGLHRVISFGGGFGDIVGPMSVLAGFAIVASALASRFLRF